jgi:hypothetical protein
LERFLPEHHRRVNVAAMASHLSPLAAMGEGFRAMAGGGHCLDGLVEPPA